MPIPCNAPGQFTPADPIPSDTYTAFISAVVDFGTQDVPDFKDRTKIKQQRQVRVGFVIPDLVDKDGRFRMTGRTYTASLDEKAGLRKLIHAAEGRIFADDAVANYDLERLLRRPVLLSIVQKPRNDGKGVYSQIDSVMALPRGINAKAPESVDYLYYSIDDHGTPGDDVPKWMREEISKSYQFRGAAPSSGARRASDYPAVPPAGSADDFDEHA